MSLFIKINRSIKKLWQSACKQSTHSPGWFFPFQTNANTGVTGTVP